MTAQPDTHGVERRSEPTGNEAGLRILLDSVRDYAIYMLDTTGIVVSWNAGAERIKGYAADEIIGRHFSAFYRPGDVEAGHPERELRIAAETGRYEEEGWRVRKDGTQFRAHVVVNALYGPDGSLNGFAKVTQDVTTRWQTEQALRESEERFRVLVEQIHDYAIIMLDPAGRIATWNLGASRIKGYRADEVLGQSLSLFYTEEDRATRRAQGLLKRAETTGVAHDIGWRVRKGGGRFWADVTLTALRTPTGDLYGFAKVVRDLTERVEAEAQAKAYEAAKEAIQVRDEFLSIAAHELRTPLTAVQLQLQSLCRLTRQPAERWKPARIVSGVTLAKSSSDRLSDLIETLLDVSRIATNRIQLNLSEFDLSAACRDALERLGEIVSESGCEVRFRAPPEVLGRWDRLRIEQALMNLVSNACKYAPDSTIEVDIETTDDTVRLSVTDSGPGIAPENIERVFGRFERAVSSTNYGGLGLGLYLTRQIAEVHSGHVEVDSEQGRGSSFTLSLPRRTPDQPETSYLALCCR